MNMDSKKEHMEYANIELFNKGNLDVIEEIFSVDYVVHSGGKQYSGHSFIRRFVEFLRTAIPDLRIVDIKVHLQQDDTIVWQRTLTGTHKTDMMGIPPSEKKVEWRDMVVSRFESDLIVEEWVVSELLGEMLVKKTAV